MLLLLLILAAFVVYYYLSKDEQKQNTCGAKTPGKTSAGKAESEDDELFNTDLGDFDDTFK
ncbi:MAG: hypothetical protein IKN71_00895 [Alphaproteobacteria bacterium]|nr:hypothetical protein [Alphaproteobacteria bacterium]